MLTTNSQIKSVPITWILDQLPMEAYKRQDETLINVNMEKIKRGEFKKKATFIKRFSII